MRPIPRSRSTLYVTPAWMFIEIWSRIVERAPALATRVELIGEVNGNPLNWLRIDWTPPKEAASRLQVRITVCGQTIPPADYDATVKAMQRLINRQANRVIRSLQQAA